MIQVQNKLKSGNALPYNMDYAPKLSSASFVGGAATKSTSSKMKVNKSNKTIDYRL
jgi:hypothetical protein